MNRGQRELHRCKRSGRLCYVVDRHRYSWWHFGWCYQIHHVRWWDVRNLIVCHWLQHRSFLWSTYSYVYWLVEIKLVLLSIMVIKFDGVCIVRAMFSQWMTLDDIAFSLFPRNERICNCAFSETLYILLHNTGLHISQRHTQWCPRILGVISVFMNRTMYTIPLYKILQVLPDNRWSW